LLLLVAGCACVVAWSSIAQAGCCGGGISTTTTPSYYVIAVKDCSGAKSVESVTYKEFQEREKSVKEDYIAAYKAWKKDKSSPKPTRPGVLELKKFKGKEAKTEAAAFAAKLQEKLAAKSQAAQDKELANLGNSDGVADE